MEKDFFKTQSASSRIKAKIVAEYFPKYCRIILTHPQQQIRYVDLFAGPGIYEDGSLSTPILVGKACSKDNSLVNIVWQIFNDNEHIDKLKINYETHFPKGTFKYEPIFRNSTVGEDEKIRSFLLKGNTVKDGKNPHPTLLFIDPFGYKGVDTKVLAEFLKGWGNEIFLFLNTKRIHAATENKKFDELMNELFPTTIATIRKDRKYSLNVPERLNLIVENLAKEFKNIIGNYLFFTAFKFQEEDSNATSHFILHFTKHYRGYDLVKQIYHDFDNIGATLEQNGTYTFDAKRLDTDKNSLFDFGDQNVSSLTEQLKVEYHGKTISALNLYDKHQTKTKYSRKHYVQALRKMEADGKLKSTFTDKIKHEVTVLISQDCVLQFN